MVPSTGIEPVTFPMSRERATAAPTGLKTSQIIFGWCVPCSGNELYAISAAPTGCKPFFTYLYYIKFGYKRVKYVLMAWWNLN